MKVMLKKFRKIWQLKYGDAYARHAIDNGCSYFVNHEMDPNFDWERYRHVYSPYFLKYGLRIPMIEMKYYEAANGIAADYYLSRTFTRYYLFPFLDKFKFIPALHDKSLFPKVLDGRGLIEIIRPVVCNRNGMFYDGEYNLITRDKAVAIVMEHSCDLIIKPSIGSCGGAGVKLISAGVDKSQVLEIFNSYGADYLIQPCVKQHRDMAKFNHDSVNTIRIVTYRKPDKENVVLYAAIRYGSEGSICDNACSGGGFVGINTDGTLVANVAHRYRSLGTQSLPLSLSQRIPNYDKVKEAVLMLHRQMPYFDIMAWDVAIREDGLPVLIEYNIRFDVGFQASYGPAMSKEYLDEILPQIAKAVGRVEITDWITFPRKDWNTCIKAAY